MKFFRNDACTLRSAITSFPFETLKHAYVYPQNDSRSRVFNRSSVLLNCPRSEKKMSEVLFNVAIFAASESYGCISGGQTVIKN